MTINEADNWYRANTRPNLQTIDDFDNFFAQFAEAHTEMNFVKTYYLRMASFDKAISQLLADFAIAHPSICRRLPDQGDGAIRYEVIANGVAYSLVMAADGWVREDGGEKTQEFLSSLPREWVKAPLSLDVTSMKRTATGAEIAAAGLIQRLKPTWNC